MITSTRLIILTSIFVAVFANFAFFKNTLIVYPAGTNNTLFLISLFVVSVCVNLFLFGFLGVGRLLKPLLIILLLIAASSAYFMDSYNIIVDKTMLENVMATDMREVHDLLSFRFLGYLFFIFLLPAVIIYRIPIKQISTRKAILSRGLLLVVALGFIVVNVLIFSMHYTSFIRENKMLRAYITPAYPLYSSFKYMGRNIKLGKQQLQPLARDAKREASGANREIIVMVVGEAARADHFSLNGYTRQTNPLLEKEDIISFTNVWSCGTSTAASLPCMFSILGRNEYKKSKANHLENLLDVVKYTGVNVYWLDNNSSSKGVAKRIHEIDFRYPDNNPICDPECRDVGMLAKVQDIIDETKNEDVLIVLHQMGSHGPAYYKRYPKEFEQFTPVCRTNQLEKCSREEITNAYDNTILYTDYFLSELIALLKKTGENAETSMLYISDHGESLGENNLYLHGLPYMLAPDIQKRVPMVMWFNSRILNNDIDFAHVLANKDTEFSHDNLFHIVLGLFEISTEVYSKEMDIIKYNPALPE